MKNWKGYQAAPVRSTAEKRNASKGESSGIQSAQTLRSWN